MMINNLYNKFKHSKQLIFNSCFWLKPKEDKIRKTKEPFLGTVFGFICVATAIILIWLSNFFLMQNLYGTAESVGAAGDMFGGITALFSGLAFAGLITTLFMQQKELELQRSELKQTRAVFSVQRFEHTFFGLLDLLNKHIQSIEVPHHGFGTFNRDFPNHIGRGALEKLANELPIQNSKILKNIGSAYNPEMVQIGTSNKDISEIVISYDKLYSRASGVRSRAIFSINIQYLEVNRKYYI